LVFLVDPETSRVKGRLARRRCVRQEQSYCVCWILVFPLNATPEGREFFSEWICAKGQTRRTEERGRIFLIYDTIAFLHGELFLLPNISIMHKASLSRLCRAIRDSCLRQHSPFAQIRRSARDHAYKIACPNEYCSIAIKWKRIETFRKLRYAREFMK